MLLNHRSNWTVVVAFCTGAALFAQTKEPARNSAGDWPMYNRDLAGTRYSPLTQINSANVDKLTQAWTYRLQPEGKPPLGGGETFQEITPIVVNGVLYTTAGNRVVALE